MLLFCALTFFTIFTPTLSLESGLARIGTINRHFAFGIAPQGQTDARVRSIGPSPVKYPDAVLPRERLHLYLSRQLVDEREKFLGISSGTHWATEALNNAIEHGSLNLTLGPVEVHSFFGEEGSNLVSIEDPGLIPFDFERLLLTPPTYYTADDPERGPYQRGCGLYALEKTDRFAVWFERIQGGLRTLLLRQNTRNRVGRVAAL